MVSPVIELADAAGVVTADVGCRRCGYLLRGLRVEGACPECGAAVGDSLRADVLRFADASFVRSLARGAYVMAAGMALYGVVRVFAGVVLVRFMTPATARVWMSYPYLLPMVLAAVGAWMLTRGDPGRPEWMRGTRAYVRWMMVGAAVYQVAMVPLWGMGGAAMSGVLVVVQVVGMGVHGMVVVAEVMQFRIVEAALGRVPARAGAVAAAGWVWGSVRVGLFVVGTGMTVMMMMTGASGQRFLQVYSMVSGVLTLGLVVAGVVAAVVLARAGGVLKREARVAEGMAGERDGRV